ncbi:enoyl-[acyl-carrier-protein] reductase, mitochondrial-like isoform X2 [Hyposmocoma kahamanoa]|uniref:enoyl-[acyl-carrier-protein] reductase, mitochondrial-like isoform X2 n=1 Tax=Hyposmocoma kahamanoa TaxID=1477025 RepID=UPI000E6D62AF|nr:enoyl-[acyl-carrier-protein] reductase, mitochondrial-like isoform X2 [Hyposmocoma kahamanoa]
MALFAFRNRLLSSVVHLSRKNVDKICERHLTSKQLVYSEFGDPAKVLKCQEVTIENLKCQDVLVRMLAAPINPADINTIQGKYPVKITLPSIPGNEGVGIVEDVGHEVENIRPGDKIIFTKSALGTWRNIATFNANYVRVIPDCIGVAEAAMLTVNPCTAYRMLKDFVSVKECKQVVIQNGGNSAVGQNVIQFCKEWHVPNISIVRARPNINELKKDLQSLGATYVFTEEEIPKTTIFKEKQIEKPVLALNCVGGKQLFGIIKHLQHSGKMVTYGGMSKKPVISPTSAFIFKNISFHGFWMTRWNMRADARQRDLMLDDITNMILEKKLKPPVHKMVKFDNFKEALNNTLTSKGFTGCKYVLDFC